MKEPTKFDGKYFKQLNNLPPPDPSKKIDDLLFGGMDFAKRVHSSALEILQNKGDKLEEVAYKVWEHTQYKQISIDTHRYYKTYPMTQIGFDRSGVGDAAIELFDTVTLPMIPIITTNKQKVDMVNSIQILLDAGQLKLAPNSPVKAQLEGQEQKINKQTNTVSYPHGSVPNDSLLALGYAVYVAIPFLISADIPMIIRKGSDNLNYMKYDVDAALDKLMGVNPNNKYRGTANKLKFYRQRTNKFI